MKFFIGDNRELIHLDYYIDEGEEGSVYRYGNEAIKIYWEDWQNMQHDFLTEEEALKMSKLYSKYILLPRRLVYNEHNEFCGYSTNHINGFYGDRKFVLNYEMERRKINNMFLYFLAMKFNKVYQEMQYLSKKGVILADLDSCGSNYIYNGNFYLIDPGCYTFSDQSYAEILKINILKLNEFFLNYGLSFTKNYLEKLTAISPEYTVVDFIKREGRPFERTRSFRYRLDN